MTTVKFDKDSGKKVTVITQQYSIGLYVAIYVEGNSMPMQLSSELEEVAFHANLRKDYPDYIKEESSIIEKG